MQRIPEAKEYFTQSISNSPPMKEALLSFAAFSENNGQNEAALKLLDKYHSYYGETLDTMVAKARILINWQGRKMLLGSIEQFSLPVFRCALI